MIIISTWTSIIGPRWLGTLLIMFSSLTLADNTLNDLSEQLPSLLDSIKERQKILSEAINRGGVNSQTSPTNREIGHESSDIALNAFNNGLRDPFTMTQDIIQQMDSDDTNTGTDFQSSTFISKLPKLKLRGIITKNTKSSPIALLDVGGDGVHMVRIGDEISFSPVDPGQVLKIKSINRLSITVEVGTLGDFIVVR